jgi:hypothetical protein
MNPMLLAALMSFAPGLLGSLFGDPNKKLRKKVGQLTSAGNVGRETDKFYQMALGSPAFSQAQGGIAAGANMAGADLSRALGARGIGTSGTSAVMSSMIPSLVGSQQAGLRTSAYGGAQQQAQQSIQAQLNALLGTQGASPGQQLFAGGMEAFAPFLQQLLSRYMGGGLPMQSLAGASQFTPPPPARR